MWNLFEIGEMKTCEGKIQFTNFNMAQKALIRSRAKDHKGSVYKCKECGFFHIGTAIGKRITKPKVKVKHTKEIDDES